MLEIKEMLPQDEQRYFPWSMGFTTATLWIIR